jgi:hypothetical protein
MWEEKRLKRIIRLGSTVVVTLPSEWVEEFGDYVWVMRTDRKIIIIPDKVD